MVAVFLIHCRWKVPYKVIFLNLVASALYGCSAKDDNLGRPLSFSGFYTEVAIEGALFASMAGSGAKTLEFENAVRITVC
jgi:hypothetical protein